MTFSIAAITSWALATIRATLFFLICPPFNSRALTGRLKAMLGAAFGLFTMHYVPPITGTGEFIVEAVIQAAIGFGMGFIIFVTLQAIRSAGALIDLEGGLSMAMAFDPMSMTQGGVYAKYYNWVMLALLFTTNGYQLVVMGLAYSYQAVPIGARWDWGNVGSTMAEVSAGMFMSAILIGGPLLAILFLTDVGLGLLTRVAPALNAFALGFPLKIFMSISFIGLLVLALPRVVKETMTVGMTALQGVMQ